MRTINIALVFAIMTVALSSFAATHNSDGCGVGWQYTNKKTIAATTTRQTTNSGSAFGMSSGTLGCEKHPWAKNEIEAVNFAASNFDNLSIEMAQGQGEYLSAMANTMGCDSAAFTSAVKANYGEIVADSGVEMYQNLKKVVAGFCAI